MAAAAEIRKHNFGRLDTPLLKRCRVLREARASDEKSFEPGHPSIARSQSNLATVLQDLGELEQARNLLRKAYSASLERFGADHLANESYECHLNP